MRYSVRLTDWLMLVLIQIYLIYYNIIPTPKWGPAFSAVRKFDTYSIHGRAFSMNRGETYGWNYEERKLSLIVLILGAKFKFQQDCGDLPQHQGLKIRCNPSFVRHSFYSTCDEASFPLIW